MSQSELQFSTTSINQLDTVGSKGEGSLPITVVLEQLKVEANSEDSEEYDK